MHLHHYILPSARLRHPHFAVFFVQWLLLPLAVTQQKQQLHGNAMTMPTVFKFLRVMKPNVEHRST
jgi:hypothetical protein